MTGKIERNLGLRRFSRRDALAGSGICFAMLSQKVLASEAGEGRGEIGSSWPRNPGFTKESCGQAMVEVSGIHQGKGKGRMKLFRFDGAAAPAHFLIYDLPPGSSEGTHTHFLDNRNGQGSFDEYYYIVSGQGQMEINGEIVTVAQGDHVHTPLEVSHGIENTDPTRTLRVFLTYIKRGDEASPMPRTRPPAA